MAAAMSSIVGRAPEELLEVGHVALVLQDRCDHGLVVVHAHLHRIRHGSLGLFL
jgi:hypothetical protein